MKVYSNVITEQDIIVAVRDVPRTSFQNTYSREGWYVPIRSFNPRREAHGFEFFLSGSSPHRAQHDRDEYAATWTEWGLVIDALYRIDPDARIGHYDSREAFHRLTDEVCWIPREQKPWLKVA